MRVSHNVTINNDNKRPPPNITDIHNNYILYTPTMPQTQTSELHYITHDNKRKQTTAIFTNDKSKQHNQPKPPKTTWRKRMRKKTEQENEWKFYF